jgi:hypothetical protein
MLAIRLQVIGDATEPLHLLQGAVQGLNVGLPAARAVGSPTVGNGGAKALAQSQQVGGAGGSDADPGGGSRAIYAGNAASTMASLTLTVAWAPMAVAL